LRTSSVDLLILEILGREQTHLTSHELYQQIHGRLPAVDPSTIYRALERLAHRGSISVSDMGSGAAVYESIDNGVHHHLVCQQCGKVVTLSPDEVAGFFASVQRNHKFTIVTNHLILFGVCEECQGRESNKIADPSIKKQ
jgi:Fur family ferric uptake transcriptional regulator